jgi:hypothetical protein
MIRQLSLEETRKYIKDDSVRPHLSAEFRTSENRQVWGLFEGIGEHPLSVVCVAFAHGVPECESELDWFSLVDGEPTIDPPHFDPLQFNPSAHETLEAALEHAREHQGDLRVFDNGTILNRFGESMIYDTAGNLAPAGRNSIIQLEQNVAVFYTIWSYSPGAGRDLINQLGEYIWEHRKDIWRWVTLSPITATAERFHLKNGAVFVDRYGDCQTFEYTDQFFDLEERMQEVRAAEEAETSAKRLR